MYAAASAPPASAPAELTIRAAQMDDIGPIVALHREAFADKFGGAFGPAGGERGAHALATTWRRQGPVALRGMLVAAQGGAVIGTTSIRTREMLIDEGGTAEIVFQETLGAWGALRSLFALSLLDHQIARGEGFITDVAVAAAARRRGVARALLARAEAEARARGSHYLSLYVSSTNLGARTLYERLGFATARIRRSLFARLFFGQGSWIYMRKDLV